MGDLLHFPRRAVHLDPATPSVATESAALQEPGDRSNSAVTKPTSVLAADWITSRRRTGEIRPLTARTQGQVLDGFLEYLPRHSTKIRQRHIEDWLESMSQLAAGTRRTRWSVAMKFLDWLVASHHLNSNPMRAMKAPKVPRAVHRALDEVQVKECLFHCDGTRDELVMMLGVQMGLRRAEMSNLQWGDVFFAATPKVLVKGKGGHERAVTIPAQVIPYLRAWQLESGHHAGWVFPSNQRDGEPVLPETLGRWVAAAMARAGVKHAPGDGMSTHALRHTAATDVYEAHHDVLGVQQMLGHQSLQTTQVYVQGLDLEHLAEIMEGRHYG